MANSTAHAARIRLGRNVAGRFQSSQSFSRLNPGLVRADVDAIMNTVNDIRDGDDGVLSGFYTVIDRLTQD